MAEVRWLRSLEDALRRAKEEKKLVLLDFFSPV